MVKCSHCRRNNKACFINSDISPFCSSCVQSGLTDCDGVHLSIASVQRLSDNIRSADLKLEAARADFERQFTELSRAKSRLDRAEKTKATLRSQQKELVSRGLESLEREGHFASSAEDFAAPPSGVEEPAPDDGFAEVSAAFDEWLRTVGPGAAVETPPTAQGNSSGS